jgi:hypothetical protein
MVVADEAQLSMAGAYELENDAVGLVDAKAPDFVVFRVKFLGSE